MAVVFKKKPFENDVFFASVRHLNTNNPEF